MMPSAYKTMKGIVDTFKNMTVIDQHITIRSSLSDENRKELKELAMQLIKTR